MGYGVMDTQLEFIINLTAFYLDGRRDRFTVKCKDIDEESARYSVWHELKSLTHNQDIECLITSLPQVAS
jgi:isoleucyl-tRNA synthetase